VTLLRGVTRDEVAATVGAEIFTPEALCYPSPPLGAKRPYGGKRAPGLSLPRRGWLVQRCVRHELANPSGVERHGVDLPPVARWRSQRGAGIAEALRASGNGAYKEGAKLFIYRKREVTGASHNYYRTFEAPPKGRMCPP
jgi:hypothetical protein